MTKEEANRILIGYVKACEEDDLVALERFSYEEVIEAMRIGAEALSEPSLPSNLDEAAEKYAKENCENYVDEEDGVTYIEEAFRNTFKAGAEWMAGQGKTKEAVIGMATKEISINVSEQTLNELDLCPGDRLIVQIRKK